MENETSQWLFYQIMELWDDGEMVSFLCADDYDPAAFLVGLTFLKAPVIRGPGRLPQPRL